MQGYAKPHVWNIVAKILREKYPTDPRKQQDFYRRDLLDDIALTFAERFTEDEGFDIEKFMNQCRRFSG